MPGLAKSVALAKRRISDLHVAVWLDFVLNSMQVSLNHFAGECAEKRIATRASPFRWRDGTHPNSVSVKRVDRLAPGSRDLFESDLWKYLSPSDLEVSSIHKSLRVFRAESGSSAWKFPNDEDLRKQGVNVDTFGRNDLDGLASRGDIYGFATLLGLLREAECIEEPQLHIYRAIAVIRAVPSLIARPPWCNFRQQLFDSIDYVFRRQPMTMSHLRPNWSTASRLADNRATAHPIDWKQRPRPEGVVDAFDYIVITMPPPSYWASWLSSTSGSDLKWINRNYESQY